MYREHRETLLERLRERRAAAVIPTATEKVRNHDCDYRFRPDSDFWYLTGFAEPDAVLVLVPAQGEGGVDQSVLFLRERDRDMEIWSGRRLGVEAAPTSLAVDLAFPIEELWDRLPGLLGGYERIVYRTGMDTERDTRMLQTISTLRRRARGSIRPPVELIDHVPWLHELRLLKHERELELMRRAVEITHEAHVASMAAAQPGVGENEIDALIEYTFRRRGSTGAAYTNIVAGGANATCLHYVENNDELLDGQLLLIDAGAEFDYYASDVTRTFPVNGAFTPDQRALYEVVLRAQKAGIDQTRPGVTFDSVHEVVREQLVGGMIELGLLEGTTQAAIESEQYRRFFMHRTSHWLGLDVHDCGYYSEQGRSRSLEPGMIITIEPGIYIAADEETVEERWRGIGIRIEDDILVTESGRENLTASIPKEVDQVEAACRGEALQQA